MPSTEPNELNDRVRDYRPELDGNPLTHGGFLQLLATSRSFRQELSGDSER